MWLAGYLALGRAVTIRIEPSAVALRGLFLSMRFARAVGARTTEITGRTYVLVTPEIAGMTTRELVMILRGLAGMNLVSGDVVEVAPAYDHAELTSLAAATTVYELACLMAVKQR